MPSTSTTKIYYVNPSATPLSTQNYTVTLNTSLTRPTTRCHFQHPAKPFRLKHPASLNTTSLAAPRTNLLKAANKNFRCCVLLKKSLVIHLCALKNIALNNNLFTSPVLSSKPLYTSSIYFLFLCVFFLVPNRPQQLGNEEFAKTIGFKTRTLLKYWQTSFQKELMRKTSL